MSDIVECAFTRDGHGGHKQDKTGAQHAVPHGRVPDLPKLLLALVKANQTSLGILLEGVNDTLCTVARVEVEGHHLPNLGEKADQEREISPSNELEEEPIVTLSDAVVSEYAMVVHVLNAPVTPAAMVHPIMCPLDAALTARRQVSLPCTTDIFVLTRFKLCQLLARGHDVARVRAFRPVHARKDHIVAANEEA